MLLLTLSYCWPILGAGTDFCIGKITIWEKVKNILILSPSLIHQHNAVTNISVAELVLKWSNGSSRENFHIKTLQSEAFRRYHTTCGPQVWLWWIRWSKINRIIWIIFEFSKYINFKKLTPWKDNRFYIVLKIFMTFHDKLNGFKTCIKIPPDKVL